MNIKKTIFSLAILFISLIAYSSFKMEKIFDNRDNSYKNPVINYSLPDPSVIKGGDGYFYLYATEDIRNLPIHRSKDLIHWEKKGMAFSKAYNSKFLNTWSKSASIITKMIGDRQVAAKIDGKYWMYWGEGVINLAWSNNLIDWNPLLDGKGNIKTVVSTRKTKFDSGLAECGPPALITDEGIVLLYNGKNSEGDDSEINLPKGTYSVGRVVFDINQLDKIISRSETCLLKPTLPHELTGQYKSGTTFAEGLVYFKSKWFLYYGTADSFVGVAIAE